MDHINLSIDARMISHGGIGTVIKNLIPLLSSPPFKTDLISGGAPIYSVKEQFAIPRLIPKTDLFWSPHYNVPLLPIKAKKRIVTIHDAYHLAFKKTLSWKKRLYAEILFGQAVSRSDLILTVSKFSANELCRLLPIKNDQIQVIYSGVDRDHFAREISAEFKESLIKKYSLPRHFFLFVGNVKPHKNLQLILDAYEQFSIELPLVLIGKTPVLSRNKVLTVGQVPYVELPAFYQMARALIFPSLYEGFGLPPLEAMAAGCPTIVSSAASIPEICGDAALFIDPNSVDDLASKMRQMIQDDCLRSTFQEKGREHVKKFSWEFTGAQYRKVFEEIHFS